MSNLIVPPAIPSLTIGGVVFTDLTNLIVLTALAGASPNSSGRLLSASAGYQVPVGKTLRLRAFKGTCQAFSSNSNHTIGYSDNDCGMFTATAPTNRVNIAGTSQGIMVFTAVAQVIEGQIFFDIPAGKYVFFVCDSGSANVTCQIYGYLI